MNQSESQGLNPSLARCSVSHHNGAMSAATTPRRVGYIGLGNLGFHLAHSLLKAGHTLTVTDINKELAEPLLAAGAQWADTAKGVAEASDVVFTCLPSPQVIDRVVTGPDGLLAGLAAGGTWIDNSTNELVAQGKVKRDTLDEKPIETDNRIQRDEWEKALPMTRAAGESWAPFINLRNASAADFDVIDKNRGGHISFPEFCEWLEAAEIEAGTPFGLDLGVGE